MKITEKYGITTIEFSCTDSTNEQAKKYAQGPDWKGSPTVITAEEQTMGRGRYSRKFYSKSGAGAYISLLFKPDFDVSDTTPIVALTAISMIFAIEKQCNTTPQIKWVNDLVLGGRKLGGILIEGMIDPKSRKYDYLIAGIGVNLYGDDFDSEIRGIATSLEAECGKKIDKEALISDFTSQFLAGISALDSEDLFNEYKSRLITLGKAITVTTLTESYPAFAISLNRDYSLNVKKEDGTIGRVFTGEVSVRATRSPCAQTT